MIKLPFFQNSKAAPDRFLAVDINSNDVKCLAIYGERPENQPSMLFKVLGQGKVNLEAGSVRGGTVIGKDNVEEALRAAAAQATEHLEIPINNVIFGINGDMCQGLMTTIRSRRPTDAAITNQELATLQEKINETAYIQAQSEYMQSTGDADAELEIVTSTNIFNKIDGAQSPSLEGRAGRVLEIAEFNAFAPSFHLESLQYLAKKTGLNIMAIGSQLYSISQQVRKQFTESDFVLLDISSDSTNAAVVFGNGIVATKSFYIGTSHMIEGVASKMGLSYRDSERILRSYLDHKLTLSESTIVKQSLDETVEIWLCGLETLFEEFSGVKTFPTKIFLSGDGSDIEDVVQTLRTEPWTKSIPFKTSPEFVKLSLPPAFGVTHMPSEWIPTASLALIFEELNG